MNLNYTKRLGVEASITTTIIQVTHRFFESGFSLLSLVWRGGGLQRDGDGSVGSKSGGCIQLLQQKIFFKDGADDC